MASPDLRLAQFWTVSEFKHQGCRLTHCCSANVWDTITAQLMLSPRINIRHSTDDNSSPSTLFCSHLSRLAFRDASVLSPVFLSGVINPCVFLGSQ